MPKRIRKPKRPADVNQWAHALGEESTRSEAPPVPTKEQISAIMSVMGKKGGKIGGKRRMETMTPERRRQIALKAAQTRWKKRQKATQS
jgi:hypothetical protein